MWWIIEFYVNGKITSTNTVKGSYEDAEMKAKNRQFVVSNTGGHYNIYDVDQWTLLRELK